MGAGEKGRLPQIKRLKKRHPKAAHRPGLGPGLGVKTHKNTLSATEDTRHGLDVRSYYATAVLLEVLVLRRRPALFPGGAC